MPAKKYILKSIDAPVIEGKLVKRDPGMGGIKLIIQEENIKSSLTKKDKRQKIYLKPLKTFLASNKQECEETYGKNAWGNSNSQLSNTWVEITSGDYDSFQKEFMFIRHILVDDQSLIANLNKVSRNEIKEFIIGEDRKIAKLSLMNKARIFVNLIRNI